MLNSPMCDPAARAAQGRIDDWLYAILRYSITGTHPDKDSVLAIADVLDRGDTSGAAPHFFYFSQVSRSVCAALDSASRSRHNPHLMAFIGKVDERRLRHLMAKSFFGEDDAPSSDPVKSGNTVKGLLARLRR